jgi:hypothetical protein
MNPDTAGRIRTNQAPKIGIVFPIQLKEFFWLKFDGSFGFTLNTEMPDRDSHDSETDPQC